MGVEVPPPRGSGSARQRIHAVVLHSGGHVVRPRGRQRHSRHHEPHQPAHRPDSEDVGIRVALSADRPDLACQFGAPAAVDRVPSNAGANPGFLRFGPRDGHVLVYPGGRIAATMGDRQWTIGPETGVSGSTTLNLRGIGTRGQDGLGDDDTKRTTRTMLGALPAASPRSVAIRGRVG